MAYNNMIYPAGKYLMRVDKQFVGEGKTGNAYFSLSGLIYGKYRDDAPDENATMLSNSEQSDQTVFISLTEDNIDRAINDLKALGFAGSLSQLDPEIPGATNFVGQVIVAYCSLSKDKQTGKDRNFWSTTAGGAKPLEKGKLSRLDVLFGKKLKEAGMGMGMTVAADQVASLPTFVPPTTSPAVVANTTGTGGVGSSATPTLAPPPPPLGPPPVVEDDVPSWVTE